MTVPIAVVIICLECLKIATQVRYSSNLMNFDGKASCGANYGDIFAHKLTYVFQLKNSKSFPPKQNRRHV